MDYPERTIRFQLRAGLLACLSAAATVWAQGASEQGFRLMSAQTGGNCLACHTVPGLNGSNSTFGPSLQKVALRYSSTELRQWVTDARQIKTDTLMPPFGTTTGTLRAIRAQPILSPEEIGLIVAALETLK
jgi:sulfur-oxidizing protein SoxX